MLTVRGAALPSAPTTSTVSPLGAACHRLLRHEHRAGDLPLHQAHAHVHAGQQLAPRVGDFGAQRHLRRGRVHRQVGEQQPAALRQLAAVFEHDAYCRRGRRRPRRPRWRACAAAPPRPPPAWSSRTPGRSAGSAPAAWPRPGRHQRAFGHQRAADAPGDRRGDAGITQVQLRRLHRRARGGHVGLALGLRRLRIDVFLLADGLGIAQRLVARGLRRGLRPRWPAPWPARPWRCPPPPGRAPGRSGTAAGRP